jgi:hypothetical protein
MKKIIIVLLLVSVIITPCYAVNAVDALLCKRVVLCANRMTVLVNRVTSEVKYLLSNNGQWVFLKGPQKVQCQIMYEAQTALKLVCH